MDSRTLQSDSKEHVRDDLRHDIDAVASEIPLPFRLPVLLFNMISSAFRFIKPFAPQLIPLTVFALSIPVVIFFSLSAGWFVWRSIAVGWETEVFLQYGNGMPHAWFNIANLATLQPYDVSVQLNVPATPSNFALGNFMTKLTLATPSNRTIVSVQRPSIVTPSVFSLMSLFYRVPGEILMDVPLLSAFESGYSNVLAYLEIGRADQWRSLGNGEGRELNVVSVTLRGIVVHKGFRGLLTRFPLLTALVSSGAFLFVSFIILATCILPAVEWRLHSEPDASEGDAYAKPRRRARRGIAQQSVDGSELGARRSPTQKRSRSTTTPRQAYRDDVKVEPNISPAPSPSISTPLRRRRSRLSQTDSES